MEALLAQRGVKGVVVTDGQGLLVHSSGDVPAQPGVVTELMRNARLLDPSGLAPVVTIDTDNRRVVLTVGEGGGSIAVFTDPPRRLE
ncbi:hypothetical protein KFE25_001746 [Diacronema lutheri]|uniref:Late endosomal/lysosomal adaptor and MAPK and MTOR activator 5 n=1 Tax=Diacronema lutheri TaxID=2081491 RepID=A0A8J5XFC4_DIALT|nr:hypothetical protein KFE25_001746 [Diacronema lutheri]